MKQLSMFCGCFACLFLTLFLTVLGSDTAIAADVCKKKPDLPKCITEPDPPLDPDDPCANFAAPDLVFWRDSHTNLMAQVSIYAAESETGCEAKLLDVPLPEGPINDLKLAYSSDTSDGEFEGRVVWAKHRYGEPQSVGLFDFSINAGQVVPNAGMPKIIMNNDIVGTGWNIEDLDLSPNMQTLVYRINDYREVEPDFVRIFSLNIGDCLLATCPFNHGEELYFIEEWPDSTESLDSPVWGALGDRIYFVERTGDTYFMKFLWVDGAKLETLFVFGGEERIFDVSSGIMGSREVLALEIGSDPYIHGCRSIYTLDVDMCEHSACELNWRFGGIWPSWTRDGKLIHTYQGTRIKRQCKTDTVGVWDGSDLSSLLKGYEPEAAGG